MEDSPHHQRNISNTTSPSTADMPMDYGRSDSQLLAARMDQIQLEVEEKFDPAASQIRDGQTQQNQIVTAADTLVASLQEALAALNLCQRNQEGVIQSNELHLNALLKNNQDVMA